MTARRQRATFLPALWGVPVVLLSLLPPITVGDVLWAALGGGLIGAHLVAYFVDRQDHLWRR